MSNHDGPGPPVSGLTSFADAALAVVDVDPDDGDDGHECERHAAYVRQPVARLHQQPRQHQHRRDGEAVQQLEFMYGKINVISSTKAR